MLKIAITGYSGAGKSTAAGIMAEHLRQEGFTVGIHKLALPLYEIQKMIYEKTGIQINLFKQNQKVLEGVADLVRLISPEFLVMDFLRRIETSADQIIINDDLRDIAVDYPEMQKAGFIFIKISASLKSRQKRLDIRQDLNSILYSKLDLKIDKIFPDYVVVHDDQNIECFKERVIHVLNGIFNR